MAYDYKSKSRSASGTIRTPGVVEDGAMNASLDAQRGYWARNPVAPTPEPAAPAAPQNDAAYALMPPEYNPATHVQQATPAQPAAPPMDYRAAFNPPPAPLNATPNDTTINATLMNPIQPPPQVKPFVAAEALQVRGPIEAAVQPQQSNSIADANTAARAELNMIRAREAQDGQSRLAAMQQNGAQADAWTAQRDAASNARVANFRAANGADMILRGGPGDDAQKQAIVAQAAAANARLAGADARVAAANQPLPQRNFIQEAAQAETTIEGSANARDNRLTGASNRLTAESARAGAAINQQTDQQKLEQQKRISDTSAKLLAAKTPEEREQLQQSILTMLGKDPKDGYKVLPYTLPDTTSEMGAVMRGGQGFVLLGPDNRPQVFGPGGTPIGQQQPGAAAPRAVTASDVELLKKNPAMAAQFDAKFGAGSAAKHLGK